MTSIAGFSDSRDRGVEALLSGQNRILEMIANNAPLEETLAGIVLLMESQFEGMSCSVVLPHEDGQHVHQIASPSLPDPYLKAIDGILARAKVGSCVTREPVIVTDMLEDPLWQDYGALAIEHGLRSCWAAPIASHEGKVLGSFAMYGHEPKSPGCAELQLISVGTTIAALAIGRYEDDQKRRLAAETYHALVECLKDVVFSLDAEGRFSYVGSGIEDLSGYTVDQVLGLRLSVLVHSEDLPQLQQNFLNRVDERQSVTECRILRKDGSVRWCRCSARTVRASELVVTVTGILQDISERKLAEGTSSLLASIVQSATGAIISKTVEGVITSWNPGAETLYGYSAEEAIGQSISFLAPIDRADEVLSLVEEATAEPKAIHHDTVRVRKDGRKIDVSLTISPIRDATGAFTQVCILAHDISERKKQEQRLREFERVVEGVQEMITVIDREYRYVIANPAFLRYRAMTKEQVIGKRVAEVLDSKVFEESVKGKLDECFEGKVVRYELRYKYAELGERDLFISYFPIEGSDGVSRAACILQDVTESKQAEEALRQSEQNYRMFVAQSSEGIFRQDLDAPIPIDLPEEQLVQRILQDSYLAECNDALARMYGVASGQDLQGKRLTEMLVADDPRNLELTRDFIRSGFQTRDRESHEVDSQGNPKVFLNSMTGVVEYGKLLRTWGIQRDITEWVRLDEARKRTEAALRSAELKYRTIFEEAVVGIFQTTPEGRLLIANPALARMFGYDSPTELMACVNDRSKRVYVDPDARQEFLRAIERSGSVRDFEMQVYRKDGTIMWLSLSTRAVQESGVVVSHEGMCEDVSERKLLQKQLLQAQKMEAVGSLAGGIAHDFNNVLGVILGQGELLLKKLAPSDDSFRRVGQIRQAGKRGAALTEQLLAFSRQQIVRPTMLDLNRIIEDFSNMIASLIGEDVTVVRVLGPGLGRVSADAGQIEQILMNLVVNARDAMPHGGTITIRTSNMELDNGFARQHPGTKPGRYVVLTVSDSGEGMDEATAVRIFDPFYTTKAVGKGTGLGLSTVYGIVKQSGGHISVESALGEGATFSIYLPRVAEAGTVESLDIKPVQLAGGSETILLVEDAAPLREVTREFLKVAGYAVLEAGDASEAFEISERYDAEISLLITDVVLPGINGRALAERLVSRRPGTKVLYISGYTDDAVVRNGVFQSDIAFLKKPFSQEALALKVREILDAAA